MADVPQQVVPWQLTPQLRSIAREVVEWLLLTKAVVRQSGIGQAASRPMLPQSGVCGLSMGRYRESHLSHFSRRPLSVGLSGEL